jgi:hypothetical protein
MPGPTVISDPDLSGLLKNFYNNYRLYAQNLVTPLLAQLERAKAGGPKNIRWGGNGAFWDVVTGRPAGGTFSAGGFFPPDTFAQEKQATVGVARGYVTRQIDGLANIGTTSKEAAFDTILRKTYREIKSASRLLMQGALHGGGQGVLATVTTVTDTTHIIVSNAYGVTGGGQGTLLLAVGDQIAVRDTTGATLRGKAQITAITNVSHANAFGTLTLGTAIAGMLATDIVVKATTTDDSYSATIGAGVPNGLINITNRGNAFPTLHGLSSATYSIWDCVRMVAGVDTPAVGTPTEDDIWQLIRRAANWSGEDAMLNPDEFLLMMGPGVLQKLAMSFTPQRRFTAEEISKKIKGGYRALEVCGLPCFEDYYCPLGTVYLIHIPSLAWVDAKDWSFVEFEGSGQWRWIQGRDAFETTYGSYINLAALVRNPHASITTYTDTTFYTHVAS